MWHLLMYFFCNVAPRVPSYHAWIVHQRCCFNHLFYRLPVYFHLKNFIQLYSTLPVSKPLKCNGTSSIKMSMSQPHSQNYRYASIKGKRSEVFRNPIKSCKGVPKWWNKGWNKSWWYKNAVNASVFVYIKGEKLPVCCTEINN